MFSRGFFQVFQYFLDLSQLSSVSGHTVDVLRTGQDTPDLRLVSIVTYLLLLPEEGSGT